MNNSEIVERLKQALRLCEGYENSEESADRETALDYYFMRERGDEVAGRSQVRSGSLSAMVEAVLAQAMEAFSTTRVVELDSFGVEDDSQAALESDAVEYFVMKRANGLMVFQGAIKDALLCRNGVVKCWTEEKTDTETRELENVPPEALGELGNIPGAEVTLREYDQDSQLLRMEVTTRTRRLRVDPVAIENFVYLDGWTSYDLQDIPICAERHVSTRSEMIEEHGFARAQVERLQGYRHEYKADTTARDTQKHQHDRAPLDESQVPVEWYEAYVLMDLNGDGVSERWRICIDSKGTELLSKDQVSMVPYAVGAAIFMPHRLKGVSLWDKLRQNCDLETGLLRALMDNVNTTTKNRTAYLEGKIEPSDLESGRPNGDIRARGVPDVRQAIMPFNVPDLTQGILANLQDNRSVRAEMGGAALELATGNMQLNDRLGSQGLDRAYSVMEQLSALMLKNIANTLIRNTFLLAHAQLRENFRAPVPVKPSGKWITPIPANWPKRECATVRIGMSPGERARKANTLHEMLKMQVDLAREGMSDVLVNAPSFYRTVMDWGRVSDIPNPEQYWIDPDSEGAQQALQTMREQAEQIAQQQRALTAQALELEQIRAAMDKYKHDSELQFRYYDAVLGAEIEEAKLIGKATVDLSKQQMEGNDADSERPTEHAPDSGEQQFDGAGQPGGGGS